MKLELARRHWCHGQGLHELADDSPRDLLARTGWIRSLGGLEAYLGIVARSRSDIASITNAVAADEVQILPAVRGCIYLVPQRHAPLALRVADLLSARRNERDLEKAGVERAELDEVGRAVIDLITQQGPLTTRKIGSRLPDGVVRKLGDRGKKVGLSSTLPPALRQLEFDGRLSRRVQDNRLDHERYDWRIPSENPLDGVGPLSDEGEVHRQLCELYFEWAGPATRKGFAAWSGLNQTQAKAAIAAADVTEVDLEGVGEAFVLTRRLDIELAPPTQINWLPALDNFFALQEDASPLIDPQHHDVEVAQFGRTSSRRFAEVNQPLQRVLEWDGRAVGLWAWNPTDARIVAKVFDNCPDADLMSGLAAARAVFEHFGHGKAFSIDKDSTLASRVKLVDAAPGDAVD